MARLEIQIDAPPERVWAVLRDGYRYSDWVVGTQRIRGVDPDWPMPGSNLHFTAGVGPIQHDDKTTVRAYEPDRRLELEAHAWPLGTARIGIVVTSDGNGGSRMDFDEHPLRGPVGIAHNKVLDAMLWARGKVMLRRFKQLVEGGASPNGRVGARRGESA